MKVKEVHAIRLNKKDKELKEYLSQFPIEEQTNAIRELINFGLSSLKSNYQMQKCIEELQNSISDFKSEQDRKFEQILQLLNQNGTGTSNVNSKEEIREDNDSIDINKVKSSMEEALSMFME